MCSVDVYRMNSSSTETDGAHELYDKFFVGWLKRECENSRPIHHRPFGLRTATGAAPARRVKMDVFVMWLNVCDVGFHSGCGRTVAIRIADGRWPFGLRTATGAAPAHSIFAPTLSSLAKTMKKGDLSSKLSDESPSFLSFAVKRYFSR